MIWSTRRWPAGVSISSPLNLALTQIPGFLVDQLFPLVPRAGDDPEPGEACSAACRLGQRTFEHALVDAQAREGSASRRAVRAERALFEETLFR